MGSELAIIEQITVAYPKESSDIILNVYNCLLKYSSVENLKLEENLKNFKKAQSLEYAQVLSELSAGPKAVGAALCFDFISQNRLSEKQFLKYCNTVLNSDSNSDLNSDYTKKYLKDIWSIAQGALKMESIESLVIHQNSNRAQTTELIRKMLLTMVNDVRVVLVKLSEQLCQLRKYAVSTATESEKKQAHQIALVCQKIYTPLANRLGVGQIKWEMEDLVFKVLNPKDFQNIKQHLDEKRISREQYIQNFTEELKKYGQALNIPLEVSGRVKHIYSIWRKMQKKDLDFTGLFDVRAVRILVRTVQSCYRILDVLHEKYQPIKSEFSDYIASPKPNGYQSIHTIIKGPEDKIIEVQIRTFEMHEAAEMGVAAHWRYKEGGRHDAGIESRINWLRGLLEWQDQVISEQPDFEPVSDQAHSDARIYILTPEGDVVELPQYSTALDFAYHIHTQVGHRFKGAKIDGKMLPVTTPLETGQCVEILTKSETKPSRDWLDPKLGYLVSHRARQKVQQWFREQLKQEREQLGKLLIQKALKKQQIKQADFNQAVKEILNLLRLKSETEMLIQLGSGQLAIESVIRLYGVSQGLDSEEECAPQKVAKNKSNIKHEALMIDGVNNLLFHMAGCCKPVFGDNVKGYITQGKGVSVHLSICKALENMALKNPDRIVDVDWGGKISGAYPAYIKILVEKRAPLLKLLTDLLSQEKCPILSLNTASLSHNEDMIKLCVEVDSLERLSHILKQIKKLKGVHDARRGE